MGKLVKVDSTSEALKVPYFYFSGDTNWGLFIRIFLLLGLTNFQSAFIEFSQVLIGFPSISPLLLFVEKLVALLIWYQASIIHFTNASTTVIQFVLITSMPYARSFLDIRQSGNCLFSLCCFVSVWRAKS